MLCISSKPQHHFNLTIRLFSVISRTLIGGVPLCRGAVCIFYGPSWLGKKSFLFFGNEHNYTVKRHQETGQNKTKSRTVRPKATIRAEDNFIRVTSDRILTAPNSTTLLNQSRLKNVSTSTVRRRLCEAGLYSKNIVKKPLSKKQNNVKKLQGTQKLDNRAKESFWTKQSKFKIFGLCAAKNRWKSCNQLYHTNHKAWRKLCFGVRCLKPEIYTRWRANWIRPAIIVYYGTTRSHLEVGLWLNDLYSYKITIQIRPVNSAKSTSKVKRNSTSFNWCLGRRNQRTLIPLNGYWMTWPKSQS